MCKPRLFYSVELCNELPFELEFETGDDLFKTPRKAKSCQGHIRFNRSSGNEQQPVKSVKGSELRLFLV